MRKGKSLCHMAPSGSSTFCELRPKFWAWVKMRHYEPSSLLDFNYHWIFIMCQGVTPCLNKCNNFHYPRGTTAIPWHTCHKFLGFDSYTTPSQQPLT
jgi:hypothetical protein